jgi:hypothetical protein
VKGDTVMAKMTKKQKRAAAQAEWSKAVTEGRVVREGPTGSSLRSFPTVERALDHVAALQAAGVPEVQIAVRKTDAYQATTRFTGDERPDYEG